MIFSKDGIVNDIFKKRIHQEKTKSRKQISYLRYAEMSTLKDTHQSTALRILSSSKATPSRTDLGFSTVLPGPDPPLGTRARFGRLRTIERRWRLTLLESRLTSHESIWLFKITDKNSRGGQFKIDQRKRKAEITRKKGQTRPTKSLFINYQCLHPVRLHHLSSLFFFGCFFVHSLRFCILRR